MAEGSFRFPAGASATAAQMNFAAPTPRGQFQSSRGLGGLEITIDEDDDDPDLRITQLLRYNRNIVSP